MNRIKSTRQFVERSEARLHRLAASCTLAIRDLNEDRVQDIEQRLIRQDLLDAERRLENVLVVIGDINKRTRALFASPIPLDATQAFQQLP